MPSWLEEKFFKYAVGTILVLLIVLLIYYTAPLFTPILWFIAAVFLPVLFSAFLYYILRPLVNWLSQWMPRYIAILATYLFVALLVTISWLLFAPNLMEGIGSFTPENLDAFKSNINRLIERIGQYANFSSLPIVEKTLIEYIPRINEFIQKLIVNLVSSLASIAVSLALTPFVLYYFLRDDSLFSRFVLRFVPAQFQEEAQKILDDIDVTLSQFIIAQITVAGIVGALLLIGYLVIGLPHALALALFAMIFYVIPFLGTFIAIIPALIVALSISWWMTFKVILVMFIAHFFEANLITPRLMSQHLKIHPITIILLLLAAGSLYGVLGLLLVTPTYAILKVIIWNFYKISRLHYTIAKVKAEAEEAPKLPS